MPDDVIVEERELVGKVYLRCNGHIGTTVSYSALSLAKDVPAGTAFKLLWRAIGSADSHSVPGDVLDTCEGWTFVRYSFDVGQTSTAQTIEYAVVQGDDAPLFTARCRFDVAAAGQPWRLGFYSCNGFHDPAEEAKAGGIQPLWKDVMKIHKERAFHAMIGGGDQLYNDHVWECTTLVNWTKTVDAAARATTPFDDAMNAEVSHFYLTHYLKHWAEPIFSDALSAIPQILTWDDHDIWDGWGSYPEELQATPVFKGVFGVAQRFFALFQQHSTAARAAADNKTFGANGAWHWISQLGPNTAVLVLDSRSERTRKQIISHESWAMIQHRLAALPDSIKHVVVLATVPVIYPKLPVVEAAAEYLTDTGSNAVAQMLQKSGLVTSLYSQFGTVEILDDLLDHWGADVHATEKLDMLKMLQELSKARSIRFTFLSGDVHLAAVGHLYSANGLQAQNDHRYMAQIISSAIGNTPPPVGVVSALKAFAAHKTLADGNTREGMDPVFNGEILNAARNWCIVEERPYEAGSSVLDGALVFTIRCEHEALDTQGPKLFSVDVPRLSLLADAAAYADKPPSADQPCCGCSIS